MKIIVYRCTDDSIFRSGLIKIEDILEDIPDFKDSFKDYYEEIYVGKENFPDDMSYEDICEQVYLKSERNQLKGLKGHPISPTDILVLDEKLYFCSAFSWDRIN